MSQEIVGLFEEVLNRELIQVIISKPREKSGTSKIKVRPIEEREGISFQFEKQENTRVFHENLNPYEAIERLLEYMKIFKQMQITTVSMDIHVLVSKKGKMTINKKVHGEKKEPAKLTHNRTKSYLLAEGMDIPFLKDLGIMTLTGKVSHDKYDKFRQINRFLEFVDDILLHLTREKELTILDFGCGKSYLTFAMYHYLHVLQGYDCRIIGLDLKEDMVAQSNRLAKEYGYEKLTFEIGDIGGYQGIKAVDMVVSLHACDAATDFALAKAVAWGAKVILAVPCCQHEINQQLGDNWQKSKRQQRNQQAENQCDNLLQGKQVEGMEPLAPILEYGLLRERFAALLTDGLRAEYLKSVGYEIQVLEFIPLEHTAKNILLRGVKKETARKDSVRRIEQCEEFFEIAPSIKRLLG